MARQFKIFPVNWKFLLLPSNLTDYFISTPGEDEWILSIRNPSDLIFILCMTANMIPLNHFESLLLK